MAKKTLLQLKDEYIELLCSEIESLIGLANVHGWKSQNVERGKELRRQMEELEKPFTITDFQKKEMNKK